MEKKTAIGIAVLTVVVLLIIYATARARNKETMYASGTNKMLYQLGSAGWAVAGPCCTTQVVKGPDGRIYGINDNKNIVSTLPGPGDTWFRTYYAGGNQDYQAIALAYSPDGTIYHVGTNHKVYKKQPGGIFSDWDELPSSCCVDSIAFSPSGVLYGMNSEGNVYKKFPVDGNWNGPIAATSRAGLKYLSFDPETALFYAVDTQGQPYSTPDLERTAWSKAGAMGPITSVT